VDFAQQSGADRHGANLSGTAELPMLALTFTRKLRPMIIGSDSG
jgi:hypothetical protein